MKRDAHFTHSAARTPRIILHKVKTFANFFLISNICLVGIRRNSHERAARMVWLLKQQ